MNTSDLDGDPALTSELWGIDRHVVPSLASALEVMDALRERRAVLGISTEELAARLEGDTEAVEAVEGGDITAPVEALVYYAAALGTTVTFRLDSDPR